MMGAVIPETCSDFAVNKYLHTVAPGWIFINKDENKAGSMRIACWIIKTTNEHSGCAILSVCPRQQWLHQIATILGYTYIVLYTVCIVHCIV